MNAQSRCIRGLVKPAMVLAGWIAVATVAFADGTGTSDIRQARVEIRILEWNLTNAMDFDFAVLFTGDAGGGIVEAVDLTLPSRAPLSSGARLFLSGLDTGHGSFDAVIEALSTVGRIDILSQTAVIIPVAPKPAGQEWTAFDGRVSSESRIPFETVKAFGGVRLATTTEYKNTGVSFQCNALGIRYDEFVQLAIKASVKDLNNFISVGTTYDEAKASNEPLLVPVTDSREISNQILVRDGSIVIAGLLKSTQEIERRRGVPWISELPFLRRVLSSVSKDEQVRELVFLVRTELLESIPTPS
jgi:type II secretory pathway component GspD/PulD (secretin)